MADPVNPFTDPATLERAARILRKGLARKAAQRDDKADNRAEDA